MLRLLIQWCRRNSADHGTNTYLVSGTPEMRNKAIVRTSTLNTNGPTFRNSEVRCNTQDNKKHTHPLRSFPADFDNTNEGEANAGRRVFGIHWRYVSQANILVECATLGLGLALGLDEIGSKRKTRVCGVWCVMRYREEQCCFCFLRRMQQVFSHTFDVWYRLWTLVEITQ